MHYEILNKLFFPQGKGKWGEEEPYMLHLLISLVYPHLILIKANTVTSPNIKLRKYVQEALHYTVFPP